MVYVGLKEVIVVVEYMFDCFFIFINYDLILKCVYINLEIVLIGKNLE